MNNKYSSTFFVFLLVVIFISYIPSNNFYFGDMALYINSFKTMSSLTLNQAMNFTEWEPLFVILQWMISNVTSNSNIYIMITALIYIILLIKSLNGIFLKWQLIFIFFSYINFTFFYSYIFSGSRQGFAMVILLLLLHLTINKNQNHIKILLIGSIACLFHFSALPFFIVILIINKINISIKKCLIFWLLCSFLFVSGLNKILMSFPLVSKLTFVSAYSNYEALDYFDGKINNMVFLIFSLIIIVTCLMLYKYIEIDEDKKKTYLYLIKIYILFNSIFLLMGFLAYSNRTASYSWFIIPVLLWYPILNKKNYNSVLIFIWVLATFFVGLFTITSTYFL